jgi:hypothetical protein
LAIWRQCRLIHLTPPAHFPSVIASHDWYSSRERFSPAWNDDRQYDATSEFDGKLLQIHAGEPGGERRRNCADMTATGQLSGLKRGQRVITTIVMLACDSMRLKARYKTSFLALQTSPQDTNTDDLKPYVYHLLKSLEGYYFST